MKITAGTRHVAWGDGLKKSGCSAHAFAWNKASGHTLSSQAPLSESSLWNSPFISSAFAISFFVIISLHLLETNFSRFQRYFWIKSLLDFSFPFWGTVNCCLGSSQTGWGYRFISWKPNRGLGFEWILGFERIFCRRRFSVPGFRLVACFLKLFPFVESIGNLRFWVLLREFHMFTERKLNLETVVIRIWTWFRRFLQITMAVWRGRQLLAGQFLIVSKFDLCMIDCLVS